MQKEEVRTEAKAKPQLVKNFLTKYRDRNIAPEVMLEDKRQISDNENPELLLADLKLSRSVDEVAMKAKEKLFCPQCKKPGKLACYNCGILLLEDGVLPQVTLPIKLYV